MYCYTAVLLYYYIAVLVYCCAAVLGVYKPKLKLLMLKINENLVFTDLFSQDQYYDASLIPV